MSDATKYKRAWEKAEEAAESLSHALEECIAAYCPDEEGEKVCAEMESNMFWIIQRLKDMAPLYPEDERENDYEQEHCN